MLAAVRVAVTGRRAAAGLVAFACLTVAPAASDARPASGEAPCRAGQLAGSFRLLPGSQAAGHTTYVLRLRDTASGRCFVTGIPGLQMLDAHGRALPTAVTFSGPRGALAAVVVPLSRGRSALLTAVFSASVSGRGEPAGRACEPAAHALRVSLAAGSLLAAVAPPTPVCSHGAMRVSVLHTA